MRLDPALEATWPPFASHDHGPWRIGEGRGGGQRVSSAVLRAGADPATADISLAEAAQDALGQPRLFRLDASQGALDARLAARGYAIGDPSCLYAGDPAAIAGDGPDWMTTFDHWPPLAVARDLWALGGIGPDRLSVMARAAAPKAAILGRIEDRAAGIAFVALSDGIAALHALSVDPARRRKGLARHLLRAAAAWAVSHGATTLALAVTSANLPARGLYSSLGMTLVGEYHYRRAGTD